MLLHIGMSFLPSRSLHDKIFDVERLGIKEASPRYPGFLYVAPSYSAWILDLQEGEAHPTQSHT